MTVQENCIFKLIYEASPDSLWNGRPIWQFRNELGKTMGMLLQQSLQSKYDCVVPVPCTGIAYAEGVAEGIGLPIIEAISKNTAERFFMVWDRKQRARDIAQCFTIDREAIKGKKIILVDEAIFTGTTMKWLCQEMRKAGAERIGIVIPTAEAVSACEYGVQPRRQMLLEKIPHSRLTEYFGADDLHFADREFFKQFAEAAGASCCRCFSERRTISFQAFFGKTEPVPVLQIS